MEEEEADELGNTSEYGSTSSIAVAMERGMHVTRDSEQRRNG